MIKFELVLKIKASRLISLTLQIRRSILRQAFVRADYWFHYVAVECTFNKIKVICHIKLLEFGKIVLAMVLLSSA